MRNFAILIFGIGVTILSAYNVYKMAKIVLEEQFFNAFAKLEIITLNDLEKANEELQKEE